MRLWPTTCAALVLLALSACGGEDTAPGKTPPPITWTCPTPSMLMVTPNAVAVGDSITVLGQNFIKPDKGKVQLRISGTYTDDTGARHPVDLQVTPKWVNEGKLNWMLWPNFVFHPRGDRMGAFVGKVSALNAGKDGSLKYSETIPVKITTKPSIIPRMIRPASTDCASVVDGTREGKGMVFTVEAVGLRAATKDNPITFSWVFLAEQWKVEFSYNTMNPGAVVPKTGAIVLEDKITSGLVSTISDGGPKNFLLKVGSDLLGNTRLKELKTGKVPANGQSMEATINVVAMDSGGKSVRLSMPFVIYPYATMVYEGISKLAERFPPVRVTDCMPGGDIGRDVTYSESSTESRARSVGFSWNADMALNLAPIPSNPFALGINFSVGFGTNINETYSTDKAKSLNVSGQILPGQYGVFYRQTTKVYRVGKMMIATECGKQFHGGNATLTDWIYTPELATGPRCTPPSKLPPAQKLVVE